MGMHDGLPTGDFRDATIANDFSVNGPDHKNWINSMTKAYDNAFDIAIISTILSSTADKETYISPFYTPTSFIRPANPVSISPALKICQAQRPISTQSQPT